MQQPSCTSHQSKIKTMIQERINLTLLRLLLLFLVSVSRISAHAHCMHAHILTYMQNIKIHSVVISHARYHSRILWFDVGGHFDFMLISSRRILISHRALCSPKMETYVLI